MRQLLITEMKLKLICRPTPPPRTVWLNPDRAKIRVHVEGFSSAHRTPIEPSDHLDLEGHSFSVKQF